MQTFDFLWKDETNHYFRSKEKNEKHINCNNGRI